MEPLYLGDWANPEPSWNPATRQYDIPITPQQALMRDFEIEPHQLWGCNILLAYYGRGDCEGDAFVLYEVQGRLFEVNAGHDSWYGLEGQWTPERTSVAALRMRLDRGTLGLGWDWNTHANKSVFADELRAILGQLEGVDA